MALVNTSEYHLGNLVGYEEKPEIGFCRARDGLTVNLATATRLVVGDVLALDSVSGKYVPRDPAGANDTNVAVAVCIENIDVPATTDTQVDAYINGSLELKRAGLRYQVAHNAAQKLQAETELEALAGIVKIN